MRNRMFWNGIAVVLLGILGTWLWVWAPSMANALAMTFACLLLVYLYSVRFVPPLVKTNKLQFSVSDLGALLVASIVLFAQRRAPDALVAMGVWPCTLLVFSFYSTNSANTSDTRRRLFWSHVSFFVIAMIFSALISTWLTTKWPIYYDRPFEPPACVFLLVPAVLTMMTLQQDLAVNFVHPSLIAGILVSAAVASIAAAITSWATTAIADMMSPPNQR